MIDFVSVTVLSLDVTEVLSLSIQLLAGYWINMDRECFDLTSLDGDGCEIHITDIVPS